MLHNFADFTYMGCFSFLLFLAKGFLSVPFLPATGLSLHLLFSFPNVVVLFGFLLPLSLKSWFRFPIISVFCGSGCSAEN